MCSCEGWQTGQFPFSYNTQLVQLAEGCLGGSITCHPQCIPVKAGRQTGQICCVHPFLYVYLHVARCVISLILLPVNNAV